MITPRANGTISPSSAGATDADAVGDASDPELPAALKQLVTSRRNEARQLFLNLENNHVRAMPVNELAAAISKAFPEIQFDDDDKEAMLRCAPPSSLVETSNGRILSPNGKLAKAASSPPVWKSGRIEPQGSQRLFNPMADQSPAKHPGTNSGAVAKTNAALATALTNTPSGASTAAAVASHLLAASNQTGGSVPSSRFNPFSLVDVAKLWRCMHNHAAAERSNYIRRSTSLAKAVEAHNGTSSYTTTGGTVQHQQHHHHAGSMIRTKAAPAWRAPKTAAAAKAGAKEATAHSSPSALFGIDGRVLSSDQVRRLQEASVLRQYVAEMPK